MCEGWEVCDPDFFSGEQSEAFSAEGRSECGLLDGPT